MGIIEARHGPDLVSGDYHNVAVSYNGVARLAPERNLLPDPLFADFRPSDRSLEGWVLRHAPRPTHWYAFVRDKIKMPYFSRQTTAVPLSKSAINITDELIAGASPLDPSKALAVAAPENPETKAIASGNDVGLPAGWYCISFAWIGDEDYMRSDRLYGPGPRSEPVQISQGDGLLATLPNEVPLLAFGVVFFITAPQTSAINAQTATMFENSRFSVRTATRAFRLVGPLRAQYPITDPPTDPDPSTPNPPSKPPAHMAGLKVWEDTMDWNRNYSFYARVRYLCVTPQGSTPYSKVTSWMHFPKGPLTKKFIPKEFPDGATGWHPEVQFHADNGNPSDDGASKWYRFRMSGPYPTNDEVGIRKNFTLPEAQQGGPTTTSRTEAGRESMATDDGYTGEPGWDYGDGEIPDIPESDGAFPDGETEQLTAPTEPLETPVPILNISSGLTPGPHYVKTALAVGEREGPASGFTTQQINAGQMLRIFRPGWMAANRFDNADLGDREVAVQESAPAGTQPPPRAWVYTPRPWPAGINIRVDQSGRVRYTDTTNSNTDFVAFYTPKARLSKGKNKYQLRVRTRAFAINSGKVTLYMEEFNEAGTLTQTTRIAYFNEWNEDDVYNVYRFMRKTIQADDGPRTFSIRNDTVQVRVKCEGRGSTIAGVRNFDIVFKDWGLFSGWGRRRKQNRIKWNRHTDNGPPTKPPDNPGEEEPDPPDPPPPEEEDRAEYLQGGYCVVRQNPKDGPREPDFVEYDDVDFESGLGTDWTVSNTANATHNTRSPVAAWTGHYGYIFRKLVADGTAGLNALSKVYGQEILHARFDVYLRRFSAHNFSLSSIRDVDGTILGNIKLDAAAGTLVAEFINMAPVTLLTRMDEDTYLSVEYGINTVTGRVKVWVSRDENAMREVVNTTTTLGIGRVCHRLYLGGSLNANSTHDFRYDNLRVTDSGTFDTVQQPGNYIEYFGPEDTPLYDRYGPMGLKIPVIGNQAYTWSTNLWWEDLTPGSQLFWVRSMSAKHQVLENHGPMVKFGNQTDRQHWRRHDFTMVTPPRTAYIEIFANNLGAGTLKVHGLQLERGTVAHRFDHTNKRDGYLRVYFPIRTPGVGRRDPADELGVLQRIRRLVAAITDNALVSHNVRYRTGNNFDQLDAAVYTNDPDLIDISKNLLEVRVDLSSTSDYHTPEVRAIRVDMARGHSQLLRRDGTEYTGGTLANEITAVHAPPRKENIEMADGSLVFARWGTKRVHRIKFNLEAYRRATVREIVQHDRHILETPDTRYHLVFEETPEFTPLPTSRVYLNDDGLFFQREQTSITAVVVGIENLD